MIRGNSTLDVTIYYWPKGEGVSEKMKIRTSDKVIDKEAIDQAVERIKKFLYLAVLNK